MEGECLEMIIGRFRREEGLSLVEVIVAIFLIAVALASTLPILYRMIRYTQAMRLKSKALYLAEAQMDKVRSWPIYSNDTGMAEYWISLGNRNFWDYDMFENPSAEPQCSTYYCREWLVPKDLAVIYQRDTWLIRNGNDGDYDCSPIVFGSSVGDFQGNVPEDRLVDEGYIYLSNGSTFSSQPLTFDGVSGPAAYASLNQWASYRWNNKRRFVRYDEDGCSGQYPYRGEDFVLLQVDVSWHTRLGFGPTGGRTVVRRISRNSIIRSR